MWYPKNYIFCFSLERMKSSLHNMEQIERQTYVYSYVYDIQWYAIFMRVYLEI